MLSGCESYRPVPLDLVEHREAWRMRRATGEEVVAFAGRLAVAGSPAAAFDPADGLSLAEAEVVALVFNPELKVARLSAGVAETMTHLGGRWDDPAFELDVLKVVEHAAEPWVVGSAISFSVPVSGRLRAERSRAEAALEVELQRVVEAEWGLRLALRRSWLSWSSQRLRLEMVEAFVGDLGGIVEMMSRLAQAGELPKTEAALFLVERETQRAELERIRVEVAAGEREIRALLGLAPVAPVEFVPALVAVDVPGDGEVPEKANPTLARLRAEYAVAEQTLLREVRKQFPDLTIGPQAESDQGQSRIGFVASLPVPVLNANRGGVAQARAGRELSRAAFEAEYERVAARLDVLRARLRGERARQGLIEAELVPLVDRQVADAQRLLDLGEGGSLVLLDSLVRALEVKGMLIDVQMAVAGTCAEIRHLIGPPGPPTNPEGATPKR